MRVPAVLLAFTLLVPACRSAPADGPTDGTANNPFALIEEADQLAVQDLWPGFDPRLTPVAIYDGERTLLFRHPATPDDFEPVPDREDVQAYAGRHPGVNANSSVELAGVPTATLMPSSTNVPLRARAGVLIHEADGITLELRGATVERAGQTITVRLASAR
ncbi:MAG TPA: hypothetical protein VHG09_03120 [Longimicrobiales bacterium]|nr:hypothetical protein [Longimicrobiales bacterium]